MTNRFFRYPKLWGDDLDYNNYLNTPEDFMFHQFYLIYYLVIYTLKYFRFHNLLMIVMKLDKCQKANNSTKWYVLSRHSPLYYKKVQKVECSVAELCEVRGIIIYAYQYSVLYNMRITAITACMYVVLFWRTEFIISNYTYIFSISTQGKEFNYIIVFSQILKSAAISALINTYI